MFHNNISGGSTVERSLVLVKPDGVQRGLIGEVIARFERRGLRLAGAKFMQVSQELAKAHYAEQPSLRVTASQWASVVISPMDALRLLSLSNTMR